MLVLFVVLFRVTSGTVSWSYMAELQSPKRGALGLGFFYFVSFGLGSVFPVLEESIGMSYVFLTFAVVQALALAYLYPKMKETKGLNQVQIDKLFDVKIEKKNIKDGNV